MKSFLLAVCLLLSFATVRAERGSDKVIFFPHENDPIQWMPRMVETNSRQLVFELIPHDQTPFSWKEKLVQHVYFTRKSVAEIAEIWKAQQKKAGADSTFTEIPQTDGSIFIDYTSKSQYESCIRRFIKGPDGVYAVGYYIRPLLRNQEKIDYWKASLSKAELQDRVRKK